MGGVQKMDYRANGEVVFRGVRALDPDSMECLNRLNVQGWFLAKEMGYPMKLFTC
jgi:hypothetical protein